MANAPSEDIVDILVAEGIGTAAAQSGWGIYRRKEPDIEGVSPNTVVTVYDTGGLDPNPKFLLDQPTIMIRVRGNPNEYDLTYTKCEAVKDALLGLVAQSIHGTFYVGIWQQSDIFFIGDDEKDRPVFTLNFLIRRQPAEKSTDNRDAL